MKPRLLLSLLLLLLGSIPITAQPADSDAWKTGQFGAYAIRNLSGQRLLKPRKGLNIIGRRKVVVK